MSYPPPPATVPYQPKLRGRIPLRLGIIFLILGIAGIVVGGVVGVNGALKKVDKFARVNISSSSSTITVGHGTFSSGGYVAYYEAKHFDSSAVPIVPVRLTSPSGQQIVPHVLYGGEDMRTSSKSTHKLGGLTYSYNGHHGIAVWQFSLPEAGRYKLEVQGDPAAAAGSDMAFGRSVGKSTAIAAVLIVLGVLLLVAGIVLLIVGLVKRSRSKRERDAMLASTPYGGYGPPMGAPPAAPMQPGYSPPSYGQPPAQPGYPPPPPPQQGQWPPSNEG